MTTPPETLINNLSSFASSFYESNEEFYLQNVNEGYKKFYLNKKAYNEAQKIQREKIKRERNKMKKIIKNYRESICRMRRRRDSLKERIEILERENKLLRENSNEKEDKISLVKIENENNDLGVVKNNRKFKAVFHR
ncbi:8814_t:CDS:1 [Cetraspora pellucida]|uniref:8814_t:CDS:1 n=1 Tax=Cetraspora pellucida TaxID=1433469 RepID=A0A9N8VFF3_9GLOM|nr:8814_t:CDS:1 [Cetraspora pellucida]